MRLAPFAILVSLALLLCLSAGEADAGKKAKKSKNKSLTGSVAAVQHIDSGDFITVKTGNKKKGTVKDVRVQITKDTKIERVIGKKGQKQHTAAALADIRAGSRVVVRRSAAGDQAISVEILGGGKKKKNKA